MYEGEARKKMKSCCLKLFIFVSLLALPEVIHAQLINGNFETGDLTGWNTFNTLNGGTSVGPDVVQYDTKGTGTPSLSAQFAVGETSGIIGPSGPSEGAGIFQDVSLGTGLLTINLDIAAEDDYLQGNPQGNGDAGTFELLVDGSVV